MCELPQGSHHLDLLEEVEESHVAGIKRAEQPKMNLEMQAGEEKPCGTLWGVRLVGRD